MKPCCLWVLVPAVLLVSGKPVVAQPPPSYIRDVRPFMAKYCLECHNNKKAKGGVNVETYQAVMRSARRGRLSVIPGKPDQSPMVTTTEHKARPVMPPTKYKEQPKNAEIALLRAWVAAGAKDDTAAKGTKAPTPAGTTSQPEVVGIRLRDMAWRWPGLSALVENSPLLPSLRLLGWTP